MNTPHLTFADKISHLWSQKLSVIEIAAALDADPLDIIKVMKSSGLLPRTPLPEGTEECLQIVTMRRLGMSFEEIAVSTLRTVGEIKNFLTRRPSSPPSSSPSREPVLSPQ
jgi:hypothetical protein